MRRCRVTSGRDCQIQLFAWRVAASLFCFVLSSYPRKRQQAPSDCSIMATMAPPAKAATIYPPPVKAAPAARPYRDFLTPSLHRRFTKAAFIGLVACWLASLPLASFSLFWSWFPLGPAGFRALFLFISTLSIFVLRVAQLHFGQRTTTSTFESFWQYTLSRNTILTCFWYLLSAFVFSELYIFSTAKSANLAWIDPGRCATPSACELSISLLAQILRATPIERAPDPAPLTICLPRPRPSGHPSVSRL